MPADRRWEKRVARLIRRLDAAACHERPGRGLPRVLPARSLVASPVAASRRNSMRCAISSLTSSRLSDG